MEENGNKIDLNNEYLTRAEVARLLRVDRLTVKAWEKKGLKSIRFGKRNVRYQKKDVEQFVNEHRAN
jgi:excisionase family DNA binding protein